jgi:hypothetical protein
MRTPAFAALGVFSLLAACAPVADGAPGGGDPSSLARQCFNVGQVANFRAGRTDQLFLRVGRSDVYETNAAGGCTDLDFAIRLALIPDGGLGGTRLCTGDWARVVVPGANSMASCRVQVSRRLTAEEVAALPANQRP